MLLPVTSLFVVILSLLFVRYSMLVIRERRGAGVAVGDGGHMALSRAIRVQGNLFEYGVLMALLIGLSELAGTPGWWLLILTVAFFAGRISHGYGLLVAEPDEARGQARMRWRVRGMVATIFGIYFAAATLVVTVGYRLIWG